MFCPWWQCYKAAAIEIKYTIEHSVFSVKISIDWCVFLERPCSYIEKTIRKMLKENSSWQTKVQIKKIRLK
jgi:hypothetical protein